MGTRGIMGFASGDQLVITYNHYDSYPEGLGKNVFEWAKQANLEDAKQQLAKITLVNESDSPTPEQIEKLTEAGFKPQSVSTGMDFYSWLRDCQGDPAKTLAAPFVNDGKEFAWDPGYIEWGYIVDFDKRTVEVYKGDTSLPQRGRFSGNSDQRGLPLILTVNLEDTVITTGDEFVRAVYAV
ncbi:hypothetical protein WILDE_85 [Arthrobacter phage Wilde]|uniref:Uncharacterized protein n=1 Tax=Arthrobacter phage Wilde TaxID=1772323 RepID=A0A0U4KC16_9CAUD|nr:hypothetical protein WILDE_85 [Arthrobacter phage Wilde]